MSIKESEPTVDIEDKVRVNRGSIFKKFYIEY